MLRNYPHSFSYISNVQDLFPMRSARIAMSVPFDSSTEEVIVNELIFQKFHVAAIRMHTVQSLRIFDIYKNSKCVRLLSDQQIKGVETLI